MPTLLLTTPVNEVICSEENILLLGEWSRTSSNSLNTKNIKLHKYHWDDKVKFNRDFYSLTDLYEKYLLELSNKLNIIHNRNEDLRYWRIVIGPWLRFFIDVLFDRFECVRTLDKSKIDNTYIFNYNLQNLIPIDFVDFYDQIRDDYWNHAIFSECILFFGINHTHINQEIREKKLIKHISYLERIKTCVKYIYNKFLPRLLNKIAIVEPYLELSRSLKFHFKLKQFPIFDINVNIPRPKELSNKRDKLILFTNTNSEFETLLNKIIFKLIPISYFENFCKYEKKGFNFYPKYPKIILTSNAYQSNDLFKIWTANQTKNDVKLIIEQHGGHFGIGLINQTELHQINIANIFASWGWHGKENVLPMPAFKLLSSLPFRYNNKGNVLLVTPSYPRYFYCYFSVPIAGQFLNFLDNLFIFLNGLQFNINSELIVRTDADIFGWHLKKRFENSKIKLQIDDNKKSLIKQLKNSRLLISTYNATLYIETLSMNFPTIIFFDTNQYELRHDADEYIAILKDAKIFHDNPKSAYEFFNEIQTEIEEWWFSNKVQYARTIFCNKFANTSENWISEWSVFIQKQIYKK